MNILLKPRKRLLLLTADAKLRSEFIAILTGMGFYVDYEDTLSKALNRFRVSRHPIVFLDERCIPSNSTRLYQAFYRVQSNGIVVALTVQEKRKDVFMHLADGAFDIFTVPILHDEVVAKVGRLVKHHDLMSQVNYLKFLNLFLLMLFPLLALTLWILT